MPSENRYLVINIRKYLGTDPRLREDDLVELISEFSCPMNHDVENFLRRNAILYC